MSAQTQNWPNKVRHKTYEEEYKIRIIHDLGISDLIQDIQITRKTQLKATFKNIHQYFAEANLSNKL